MSTVDVDDLITYRRISDITGAPIDSLRKWRRREHFLPVRPDLALFDWSEVRPIIALRMGFDQSKWISETAED